MRKPGRQRVTLAAVVALLFVVLCGVSFNFMNSVQNSLWENSVKNMLESTVRGADQLERGYLKELEMLRMLAEDLGGGESSNADRIRSKLEIFLSNTGNFSSLIFEDGTGYVDNGLAVVLTPEELKGLCPEKAVCCFLTGIAARSAELLPSSRLSDFRTGAGDTCSRAITSRPCTRNMLFPSTIIRGFPM